MDRAFLWLAVFIASQLAVIGIAYLPSRGREGASAGGRDRGGMC